MRVQFIICKVLQREAYLCASRSRNIVDVVLMPQGLHSKPDEMRVKIQEALERVEDVQGRPYDATILGYGLCSNGIVGVEAKITTVVARGHDCLTLMLGSKEAYQHYFDTHRGVYWYSAGWIENGRQPGRDRYEQMVRRYREKYGEENAEYLMKMEQNWMAEYSWATYIDWGFADSEKHKQFTRECAEFLGWNYDEVKGSPRLVQKLVDGEWDEDSFLVLAPGQRVAANVINAGIIKAVTNDDAES